MLLSQSRLSSWSSHFPSPSRWGDDCRAPGWELDWFPKLFLLFLSSFPKSNTKNTLEILQQVALLFWGSNYPVYLLLSCVLISVDFALTWPLIICLSMLQHLWFCTPEGFSNWECNCSLFTSNKLEIADLSASVGKQRRWRMSTQSDSRLHFGELQGAWNSVLVWAKRAAWAAPTCAEVSFWRYCWCCWLLSHASA